MDAPESYFFWFAHFRVGVAKAARDLIHVSRDIAGATHLFPIATVSPFTIGRNGNRSSGRNERTGSDNAKKASEAKLQPAMSR